jgi:hypothetical protein
MSGVGEILAITGLLLQVLAAVDKVVAVVDTARNVENELRRFRASIDRLNYQIEQIHAHLMQDPGHRLRINDFEDLKTELKESQEFLTKLTSRQSFGARTIQAIWSSRDTAKLTGHRDNIDRCFTQVINPLWCRVAATRCEDKSTINVDEPGLIAISSPRIQVRASFSHTEIHAPAASPRNISGQNEVVVPNTASQLSSPTSARLDLSSSRDGTPTSASATGHTITPFFDSENIETAVGVFAASILGFMQASRLAAQQFHCVMSRGGLLRTHQLACE